MRTSPMKYARGVGDMVSTFGVSSTVRMGYQILANKPTATLEPPTLKHPITLRTRSMDLGVFNQVFVRGEYEMGVARPEWILDLGAHIGFASVWFANTFPGVPVLSVEPDEGNFQLLQENVSGYPNVTPLHGAVWSERTVVNIQDPDADTWAFQVEPAETGVEAWPVAELIDRVTNGAGSRGLVKLDVEGAEREVLQANVSWLDRIDHLVLELHEDLAPGAEAAMNAALSDRPHKLETFGENLLMSFS